MLQPTNSTPSFTYNADLEIFTTTLNGHTIDLVTEAGHEGEMMLDGRTLPASAVSALAIVLCCPQARDVLGLSA